jgi:copper transport protein
LKSFLLALLIVTTIAPWSITSATAHATLLVSEPADGATLDQNPKRIKLTFGEEVAPLALKLLKPAGEIVQLTDFDRDRLTLIVHLPEQIDRGTSILSWRVMSKDGHPVSGTVTFTVDRASSAINAVTPDVESPRFVIWAIRLATFLLLVFCVGISLFDRWIGPVPIGLGRSVVAYSVAGCVVAIVQCLIEVSDAIGPSQERLLNYRLWSGPALYQQGPSVAAICLAHTAAICSTRSKAFGRLSSCAALGFAALAFMASGHAGAIQPKVLLQPVILLHASAFIFWTGSLIPLLAVLRAGQDQEVVLERFSVPVVVAVMVLAVTGVSLGVIEMGAVSELWSSAYGLVLSAKLLAVMPMLALGAYNRLALLPRVRSDARAIGRFKCSIAAEVALAIAIFGLAALWRFTPPPREMAAVTVLSTGIQFHAHGTRGMANLVVRPARKGPNDISIMVLDAESRPLPVQAVSLSVVSPGGLIEPIRRTAIQISNSSWKIDGLIIPNEGSWIVRVELLVSEYDKITVRTNITVEG